MKQAKKAETDTFKAMEMVRELKAEKNAAWSKKQDSLKSKNLLECEMLRIQAMFENDCDKRKREDVIIDELVYSSCKIYCFKEDQHEETSE